MSQIIQIDNIFYQIDVIEDDFPLVGKRVVFIPGFMISFYGNKPKVIKVNRQNHYRIKFRSGFGRNSCYYRITGQWKVRRLK